MGIRRGPNIVRDGLVLALDAANPTSYPGSGVIWKDQTINQNNATLINGVLLEPPPSTETATYNYLLNYSSTSFPYVSTFNTNDGLINDKRTDALAIGAESEPCSGLLTFEDALEYAHNLGGRLPTRSELLADATTGTGCGYDNELVWTIDKSNESGTERWVSGGRPAGSAGPDESRSITSTAYVRMVSDYDRERVDPVLLSNDSIVYDFLTNNFTTTVALTKGTTNSFKFDGINDYISLGKSFIDTGEIGSGNVSYTLEAWVYLTRLPGSTTNGFSIIGNASSGGVGMQLMDSNGIKVNFGYRSNNNFDSNSNLELFKWYHIVCTREVGNNNRIYINGQLDNTFSIATLDVNNTSAEMQIGYAATRITGRFGGRIDCVKIYNKHLTDQEVLQNYNALKSRFGL